MYGATVHGYVVFERVGARARRPAQPVALAADGAAGPTILPMIEDVGATASPLSARLREVLADARELWAQTTFFVLDPNSWG